MSSDALTVAPPFWEATLVALGAIPGAWLRLRVVNHFEPVVPQKHWGTFAVNVVAAFFLGLFAGLHALQLKNCSSTTAAAPLMLLAGVGFFGSLSTFSTFVIELLNVLQRGKFADFAVLLLSSVVIGLVFAGAGYQLGLGHG